MKWINKPHPKIGKFTGIRGSRAAVVEWSMGGFSLVKWMGDRWTKHHIAGANKMIRYMWLEERE